MAGTNSPKLAVLIDADNTTPSIVSDLLAEIAKYGTATVKRAYGDWTTPRLSGWKDANNSHAIQPMQQFSYTTGKNATDSALIIDAMDLLYTGNLDGFCLVSSDSDFTKLASRLRESGMTVYGFGEPKTPKPLVAACDKFVYLDVLRTKEKAAERPEADATAPAAPKRRSTNELHTDRKLVKLLRDGIDANSDDDGWAALGGVGSHVAKQAPDFDSRNWGYSKLVDLISEIGLFEVQRVAGQQVRVRESPQDRSERSGSAPARSSDRANDRPAAATAPVKAAPAKAAPSESADTVPAEAAPTAETTKPATRKTRTRNASARETAPEAAPETTTTAPATAPATAVDSAPASAVEAAAPVAKKTTRKRATSSRTTAKKAAAAQEAAVPAEAADAPEATKQVARKKTVTRNAVKTVGASTD
jgi:uncharacterized LabA/DUF88 family protein